MFLVILTQITMLFQITNLKEEEKKYAEEKRKAQHRIAEIRSQRKTIIRLDDKIAEGDNKIYSLKSELAQVSTICHFGFASDTYVLFLRTCRGRRRS